MFIVIVILIGLFVGIIAKVLTPGPSPGGWIVTALLGIVGALLATYLSRSIGLHGAGQSEGFIAAVLGAMLLFLFYRLLRDSQHSGTPTVKP